MQSLLSSLRWGYGIKGVAIFTTILAPILPVVACLAYMSLSGSGKRGRLWPIVVVFVNWAVFAVRPDAADPMILLTYLGFDALLLWTAWKGVDHVSLSPLKETGEIVRAMYLTGAALIASGLTDIYLIYDFVRTNGQNAGLVLTFVQTVFTLVIGLSGVFAKVTSDRRARTKEPQLTAPANLADQDILARLEQLFKTEKLHRNDDLGLRRLSRKLGVPDGQVSQAVNRQRHLSVSRFVNGFRIADACIMLAEIDCSVLDILLEAGFATKSNFNREFLRVTGQSPSQWRARKCPT